MARKRKKAVSVEASPEAEIDELKNEIVELENHIKNNPAQKPNEPKYVEETRRTKVVDIILRGVKHTIPVKDDINLLTIYIALLNLNNPEVDELFHTVGVVIHDCRNQQIWPPVANPQQNRQ